MATAETPNEKLIEQFFETLNAEDLDGLRPLLHPARR